MIFKPLKCKQFLLLIFLTIFFFANLQAQDSQKSEVPIREQLGSRNFRCYGVGNKIIDEQTLAKIRQEKKCSQYKDLDVDFKNQTLIGYEARGDCFIRADARVFRNNKTKTYTVRINNYWGKCRAGGSFQGWLVIDKIPSDYKVEFIEEPTEWKKEDVTLFITSRTETIETNEVDLKSCIQMYDSKQFIINNRKTYLENIRNDAQRKSCIENVENLDFEKYTFLGIQLNSGYCRRPLGLGYSTKNDVVKERYILTISYKDPQGSVCRALSRYDLWLSVPKLPENYEVDFKIVAFASEP